MVTLSLAADAEITAPCEPLAWDSEHWGFPVARVRGDTLRPEDLAGIERWCRERSIACLYFLAASDDPLTARAAAAGGFALVDERVTFGRAVDRAEMAIRTPTPPSLAIRPAAVTDIAALQRIAATSHRDSRFFVDPQFPRVRCELLYQRWIARSCAGSADRVLVVEDAGAPVGYITCHLPAGGEQAGRIGLVAVAPEARERGIGTELVRYALAWFAQQHVGAVVVATQDRNSAARALYQRCGFAIQCRQLWYHRWFREPASRTA